MTSAALPVWSEIAEHCPSASSRASLAQAILAGGRPLRFAIIRQHGEAFVALFQFEEPFGPRHARIDHLTLPLAVHPEGGLG
jgi:hypothetical protein